MYASTRPAERHRGLVRARSEAVHDGIQLELLTGPLAGIYDPNGMGAMLFAVLAVAAQLDRNYIREKRSQGQGTLMPDIARKLVIKTGKNAGKHPSVASLYRALAQTDT